MRPPDSGLRLDEFGLALKLTLRFEGGDSSHPADPGGDTRKGITQATYDRHRESKGFAPRSVFEMDDGEMSLIYWEGYWLGGKCDRLRWPLSLVHFDACVNHGPANAWRILQRAAGAMADGKPGPNTYEAISRVVSTEGLAHVQLDRRLDFYDQIVEGRPPSLVFLRGWRRRVSILRRALDDGYGVEAPE